MRVLYKKYRYLPFINPMHKIASDVAIDRTSEDDATLLKSVNHLIAYAVEHTTYYRSHKCDYNAIATLSDLKHLPLLHKNTLKKELTSFYSDESSFVNTAVLHTSGTTGSPLEIKVSISDLQLRYRLVLKTMIAYGYDPLKPLGRISGEEIADGDVIYRKDYLNNHIFLSAFHLCEQNIGKYHEAITANALEALEGYPSVIYTMAKLFELHGLKVTCVKHVFTTAEKLHPHQKDAIEAVFGCSVFDYYGSNDQSVFIFTCKNNRLHTADTTGILEVLDQKGHPAKPNEAGRMIVTSFTSHFMPLIRYEIGDMCIVSPNQHCNCDNGGVIIDEIIGRDEDIFKTAQGIYITRFSVVLKQLPSSVIESQLLLSRSHFEIILYYVATDSLEEKEFAKFKDALTKKVGEHYKITIVKVSKIPMSTKGKKKAVVIED